MSHVPCPHCGCNTVLGTPVMRGKWWIGPTGASYNHQDNTLPRYLARTLYAIAWANGAPVSHRDLPNCTPSTLAGHVSALRRTFGADLPIRKVIGRGYAWDKRA